jgi:hypothetical protein
MPFKWNNDYVKENRCAKYDCRVQVAMGPRRQSQRKMDTPISDVLEVRV